MYKIIANIIRWIGGGLAVLTIIGVGFFAGRAYDWCRDSYYDLHNPHDMVRLRQIIYSLQPAVTAIEGYKTEHSRYPSEEEFTALKELTDDYRRTCFVFVLGGLGHCEYENTGDGNFKLHNKLTLDSGLYYDSSTHEWTFIQGDSGFVAITY